METSTSLDQRAHQRTEFNSTQTVTLTGVGAYATGQVFGGLITIDYSAGIHGPVKEHGYSAILQSLAALDPDKESPTIDLFFFNKKPTATYTDRTAFAPSLVDLQNCIGIVKISATDWTDGGAQGNVAAGVNQANLGRVMKPAGAAQASTVLAGSTALYCIPVIRSTANFNTGNIYYKFHFSHGL